MVQTDSIICTKRQLRATFVSKIITTLQKITGNHSMKVFKICRSHCSEL